MATNTRIVQTVTGPVTIRREKPQGRPKAAEVKSPFTAQLSDQTRARVAEQAAKYSMSQSAYADLALYHFDMQLFASDNCS